MKTAKQNFKGDIMWQSVFSNDNCYIEKKENFLCKEILYFKSYIYKYKENTTFLCLSLPISADYIRAAVVAQWVRAIAPQEEGWGVRIPAATDLDRSNS